MSNIVNPSPHYRRPSKFWPGVILGLLIGFIIGMIAYPHARKYYIHGRLYLVSLDNTINHDIEPETGSLTGIRDTSDVLGEFRSNEVTANKKYKDKRGQWSNEQVNGVVQINEQVAYLDMFDPYHVTNLHAPRLYGKPVAFEKVKAGDTITFEAICRGLNPISDKLEFDNARIIKVKH